MILLNEVAKKLNDILNGHDTEAHTLVPSYVPNFEFLVESVGYHITELGNEETGKNRIPVFVGSLGGAYNPVPELKQANASIPITFYFPVRFKEEFFLLNDYLADVFVGQYLNYGTLTKKAISNISLPQYGEIQDLDFKEFKEWVDSLYKKQVEVMEPYMSMQITLYLTNAKEGFVYGNEVTTKLSVIKGIKKYNHYSELENNVRYELAIDINDPIGSHLANIFVALGYYQDDYYKIEFYADDEEVTSFNSIAFGIDPNVGIIDYYLDEDTDYYYPDETWEWEDLQAYNVNHIYITLHGKTLAEGTHPHVENEDELAKLVVPTIEVLEDTPVFVATSIQSQTQGNAQQELGGTKPEAFGLPFTTAYGSGFSIYYKSNEFYKFIIDKWFKGKVQDLRFTLTTTFDDLEFSRYCYIDSVNFTATKGQLVTVTFAFSPAFEEEEE